ncbi:hypothetical protein EDD37DRAFT_648297 [Exophiala viscosa]|uniref:uncharacterized protein n=1 Tax=Exophiala viscosa TaxID=2486360 RepID=UPI0021A11299|nr:hypothetical protein EDD37DRAFT_648297 [Exophiala viscosa]
MELTETASFRTCRTMEQRFLLTVLATGFIVVFIVVRVLYAALEGQAGQDLRQAPTLFKQDLPNGRSIRRDGRSTRKVKEHGGLPTWKQQKDHGQAMHWRRIKISDSDLAVEINKSNETTKMEYVKAMTLPVH